MFLDSAVRLAEGPETELFRKHLPDCKDVSHFVLIKGIDPAELHRVYVVYNKISLSGEVVTEFDDLRSAFVLPVLYHLSHGVDTYIAFSKLVFDELICFFLKQ